MTKKELQKLRKKMPPKYRETLSIKFGVTEGYIDQLLRGDKNNIEIIEEAIKMAQIHQEFLKSQKDKIKKL